MYIFHRSLRRIPDLCFYVSAVPHSLLIKAVSYQGEYIHPFLRGFLINVGRLYYCEVWIRYSARFFFCFLREMRKVFCVKINRWLNFEIGSQQKSRDREYISMDLQDILISVCSWIHCCCFLLLIVSSCNNVFACVFVLFSKKKKKISWKAGQILLRLS